MMFNLLYKELSLAAHPTLFVFTLLGALIIIPSYPYGVVFLFGCIAPFITFMYGRETNDIYYTALLPIKKSEVVKSKCLLIVLVQITQMLISLPFAFLRLRLLPEGNPVGIEANAAYYGFGLMIFGVFNFVILTSFFKTTYKVGKAFLLASLPALAGIILMESLPHFPAFAWLDGVSGAAVMRQIPILIVGIGIYVITMILAYSVPKTSFAQGDL